MKLTVRIEDALHAAAKARAAETGRTLAEVIEQALRRFLTLENRPRRSRPLKLPTFGKGGLRPGVSLDDSAGLLDAMEGRNRRH